VIKASRPRDVDGSKRKSASHGVRGKQYDSRGEKNCRYSPAHRAHYKTASLFRLIAIDYKRYTGDYNIKDYSINIFPAFTFAIHAD
jgi:hypothetical protein